MSANASPSPESSDQPAAASPPRVRRISNPRPRKTATPAVTPAVEMSLPTVVQAPVPALETPKFPEFPESAASEIGRNDWPESEGAPSGGGGPAEHAKRKRRRKKGKGHNPQLPGGTQDDESPPSETREVIEAVVMPAAPASGPTNYQNHTPRARIEPEVLATRAWKIYLSEVSEEGVALIGDTDAKELARRCFRLAELFIEEQMRRR